MDYKNSEIENKVSKNISNIIEKCFWLLIYFLSPIIPIIVIYNSNTLKYNNTLDLVSMIAGSVGFVWLGFEFILSARPKFIERCFGLDKFYVFHGVMAVVSIVIIFIHRTILEDRFGDTTLTFLGNTAFFVFIGITILGILFIASTFLLKIKLIFNIKKFFLKYSIFTYSNQVLMHNLSIVAYVIMFIHVLLTRAIRENLGVEIIFIIYFLLGLAFYIYHTFIIKLIIDRNTYIVKEVIKENDNMWTLNLEPKNGKILSYKPGQFAYIKIFEKT